jgi:hypothetical protein
VRGSQAGRAKENEAGQDNENAREDIAMQVKTPRRMFEAISIIPELYS